MNDLTRNQRRLTTRLKNLRNGITGTKVKYETLSKNNLEHLVEEYKDHIAFPTNKKRKKSKMGPKQELKSEHLPEFTKQDIIDFIKTHNYNTEGTRNAYLTAYDNTRHRDESTNFPDFTSDDLIDDETFESFSQYTRFREILCPIPAFLAEKYLKNDGDWTNIQMKTLRENISVRISKLIKLNEVATFQRNGNRTLVTTKEEIEAFYDKIITSNMDLMIKKKENAYRKIARILSVLITVQCRDDMGAMIINPSEEEKNNNTWIDLSSGTLSIDPKKRRTQKNIIDIPKKILTYLRTDYQKFPRKYMVSHSKDPNKPIGTLSFIFGRLMKEWFGKTVGFNDIRKVYTSWARENSTSQEYIDLAEKQGHGVDISVMYYNQRIPENNNSQD
tara:strand:- start:766 stop:1929 length:1164 start_codon:yes stop_codon:yes gene_type:complete